MINRGLMADREDTITPRSGSFQTSVRFTATFSRKGVTPSGFESCVGIATNQRMKGGKSADAVAARELIGLAA